MARPESLWNQSDYDKSIRSANRGIWCGNIYSGDILRAIEKFDSSGKLQALYGKRQAQIMRDLAELTRIIETAPPGAVNHSNTSSAALNAVIEMGLTASLTGVPAPMLATLKGATRFVKNRALANRINAALK